MGQSPRLDCESPVYLVTGFRPWRILGHSKGLYRETYSRMESTTQRKLARVSRLRANSNRRHPTAIEYIPPNQYIICLGGVCVCVCVFFFRGGWGCLCLRAGDKCWGSVVFTSSFMSFVSDVFKLCSWCGFYG